MSNLILGAGGKKNRAPVEVGNSLFGTTTARVLLLVTEGEAYGPLGSLATDGTHWAYKQLYFDNVPVTNQDGSHNYMGVTYDWRRGHPIQDVIPGYTSTSTMINVNQLVLASGSGQIYQTSTADIDSMIVTLRWASLFKQEDNGDIKKTLVQIRFDVRQGTGPWQAFRTVDVDEKQNASADIDFRIPRPGAPGMWGVRVVRLTPDSSSTKVVDAFHFQMVAEIKEVALPYNDCAVIGLELNAANVGEAPPTVSVGWGGILVQVPNNYNVTTRARTGNWNGLFASTRQLTDNPAWIIYDLLTHPRYGMGIDPANIDHQSFEAAAIYNDQMVANGKGGTEPRFTFNYQFMTQENAFTRIQAVASVCNAVVYTNGQQVMLVQDRPTNVTRIITNSNVIDGNFERQGSTLDSRTTQAICYYNDPEQNWLSFPVVYPESDSNPGVERYGLNSVEITGEGITSWGQAYRKATYEVETALANTELLTFQVGFANADIAPGEVIKVMDTDYAMSKQEARLIGAGSSRFIDFDRPLSEMNVSVGDTLEVVGSDGQTIYTRTIETLTPPNRVIVNAAVHTVASVGAIVSVFGAVQPQLFKVVQVIEEEIGTWTVSAVSYDPTKFGLIDGTGTSPAPVYQAPNPHPTAPLNLSFREAAINDNGQIRRVLLTGWTRPAGGVVGKYVFRYRRNGGSWTSQEVDGTSYELTPAAEGEYEVEVYAVGVTGIRSAAAVGTYTLQSTPGTGSPLAAPTSLSLISGGSTFTGPDINFKWTNPASNSNVLTTTLRDFEVRVIETVGNTVLRQFTVPAVYPGEVQTSAYTYAMNAADGGPRRQIQIQVFCRDTNNKLSSMIASTFSNPAPASFVPTVNAGFQHNVIRWDRPSDPDLVGFHVYGSTTAGFTAAPANLLYSGDATVFNHSVVAGGTWYYRVAAYDQFSSDVGTLNLSAQISATMLQPDDAPEYILTGSIFTPNSPDANRVSWTAGTVINTRGGTGGTVGSWAVTAGNTAVWSSGIMYVYWVPAAGTLSSTTSLSTINAASGVIVATYRGGTAIEAHMGRAYFDGGLILGQTLQANALNASTAYITNSAQIAGATITNGHLTVNSVDTPQIKAGAVTATEIATNSFKTDNALTRGLTVRDNSGNVILAAGTALQEMYADATLWNKAKSSGANMLYNANFMAFDPSNRGTANNYLCMSGWSVNRSTTGGAPSNFMATSLRFDGQHQGGTWFPQDAPGDPALGAKWYPNIPNVNILCVSTSFAAGSGRYYRIDSDFIGVEQGVNYIYSVYSATHNVNAWAQIKWYNDASDSEISGAAKSDYYRNNNQGPGGSTLNPWWRHYRMVTPPVGATRAKICFEVGGAVTGTEGKVMWMMPMLEKAGTGFDFASNDNGSSVHAKPSAWDVGVAGDVNAISLGKKLTPDNIALYAENGIIGGVLLADNAVTANKLNGTTLSTDNAITRNLAIYAADGSLVMSSGNFDNLPRGNNLLYNPTFMAQGVSGTSGTQPAWWGTTLSSGWSCARGAPVGVTDSAFSAPATWAIQLAGVATYEIRKTSASTSSEFSDVWSSNVPVTPGKRYIASAYVGAHRAHHQIYLQFYNSAGTEIIAGLASSAKVLVPGIKGGTALSGYDRPTCSNIAPAGAVNAAIRLRTWGYDGASTSYGFWTHPMIEEAGPAITTPSPWSNSLADVQGVSVGNPITAANKTTYIANLAVDTLQIAGAAVTSTAVDSKAGNVYEVVAPDAGDPAWTNNDLYLTVDFGNVAHITASSRVMIDAAWHGASANQDLDVYILCYRQVGTTWVEIGRVNERIQSNSWPTFFSYKFVDTATVGHGASYTYLVRMAAKRVYGRALSWLTTSGFSASAMAAKR